MSFGRTPVRQFEAIVRRAIWVVRLLRARSHDAVVTLVSACPPCGLLVQLLGHLEVLLKGRQCFGSPVFGPRLVTTFAVPLE